MRIDGIKAYDVKDPTIPLMTSYMHEVPTTFLVFNRDPNDLFCNTSVTVLLLTCDKILVHAHNSVMVRSWRHIAFTSFLNILSKTVSPIWII